MPSVRTVNLAWERQARGSYAVSRFALDDAGAVTLVLPRPLQGRTYDLTRLALDGAAEVRATFSVETLLEVEASAESDAVVGMTADDLYLIRAGAKSRFLAERRIIFVDSALAIDGDTVVAGFSDVAGSSFALALGDIGGRVIWLRESDAPISAVAMSAEGKFICQAADTGSIRLLDSSRREHWLFEQEEAVRALVCTPGGRFTAYGTTGGSVGLIDSEGSRLWDVRLPGPVLSLAIAADGRLCAALVDDVMEQTSRLHVLDATGQTGWEYDAEARLSALALSPGGRYLAASSRNGSHTLYKVIFGEISVPAGSLPSIGQPEGGGEEDWGEVAGRICAFLHERPAEVEACERLLAIRQEQAATLLADARERRDQKEYAAALDALDRLKRVAPEEPEVYSLLAEVRQLWSGAEIARAEEAIARGDADGAGEVLRSILAFAPHSLEARRRLAELDVLRAKEADAEAERLLAAEEREAGLAALERAQRIAASSQRAEKIRRAQIDLEFAEGMRAYNDKRYREAVFQFKKVLARDADHADARRHLNFAQRFEQDSNEALNDRFGRLE
jgi:tetratricopeptide (TPR) repeat protein